MSRLHTLRNPLSLSESLLRICASILHSPPVLAVLFAPYTFHQVLHSRDRFSYLSNEEAASISHGSMIGLGMIRSSKRVFLISFS
ncbi:hypothetical protein BDR04DRAFT_1101276 [Suillus decipiens]|nr:hypothetical protein BDR04DRAFT_1101276 [Suillus decipiens]